MGELFTDRKSESKAFGTALASFRRYLDGDDEVGIARHNVVTFYGLGGIGKTTLSERLQDWVNNGLPLVNGWGPPPATKVHATARIDLHGSAGQMDVPKALIALRAGAAKLRRRWPVFDLAFAAYWSAVRPGEPLPKFSGRDELGDAVASALRDSLADIGSFVDVVGAGTGAGLGVLGIRKLIGEIRRRRDIKLGVDAFAGFEGFLLRCHDEPSATEPHPGLACDIAGVLAWELSRITPFPLMTVFVDATERLALDPRRVSEGHLNELIHKMPNVLFVLTGREMLDWYDESRVDLSHRGKSTWPGLLPGAQDDPRQHLVGNLSPADTRTTIRRGRSQLDLPMSDAVVEELVKASAGLPQYLELARQMAISIKATGEGRQIEVADVTGSLRLLVMRVLDDIPADEQRAIRGAGLFRTFDTALIAAAANVDHGCAERAVVRPMIDRHEGDQFPYRMHDAVREAIRGADHQVEGGWSERDWQAAATRAARAAHRLHDDAKRRENSQGVLDAIGVAIGLVCDQETTLEPSDIPTYADWLASAIVFSPSIQGLQTRIPGTSRTDYGNHVLNFIMAKSIETPIADRMRLLRSIFDSQHPLRLSAGRHLGYSLKAQYRWDEALTVFDEVVSIDPSPLNVGQRPQVLSSARRFAEARGAAEGTPTLALITRMEEYAHGRPERYFAEIEEESAKLRATGRQREYLEEQGDTIARRAFFHGDLDPLEIEDFLEEAEGVGHVTGIRCALLATVLLHERSDMDIAAALERLKTLDKATAYEGAIQYSYALAEFCDALLTEERGRLATLHEEVGQVRFRNRSWIPVEIFLEAAGLSLPPTPTQWLEPKERVMHRWVGHLKRYLARTRTQ